MPRPDNPLKLVHSPKGRFPFKNWEDDLGTFKYFRVFGFKDFKRRARISDNSDIENQKIVEQAKKIILKEWGEYLPSTHDSKDALERQGAAQVRNVRMGKSASFQTACLAIVSLELAVSGKGSKIDIYNDVESDPHSVCICPLLFSVNDYKSQDYEEIRSKPLEFADLVDATGQYVQFGVSREDHVFKDMARGKLVTECLVNKFSKFYGSKFPNYTLHRPRNGNNFAQISNLENEVFPP